MPSESPVSRSHRRDQPDSCGLAPRASLIEAATIGKSPWRHRISISQYLKPGHGWKHEFKAQAQTVRNQAHEATRTYSHLRSRSGLKVVAVSTCLPDVHGHTFLTSSLVYG